MSTVSPFTRKWPRVSSLSLRLYSEFTSLRRNTSITISSPTAMWIVLLWKSSGFPQPYMHETELTTITSLRPLSSDAVVERRSFSISLFIARSFSI